MIPELRDTAPLAYYVYYRLSAGVDTVEAAQRITRMQQSLADSTGIRGRLLQRKDDPSTWMEIYEPVMESAVFELALQHAVIVSGIAGLIEPGSARHLERFVDLAPPCA